MPGRASLTLFLGVIAAGCGAAAPHPPASAPPALRFVALPGAPPDGVSMDYLAYDRVGHRVWVPAGNLGSVAVIDVATDRVTTIGGFATAEVERRGVKRTVGPSSATVGAGVVYVGNRGDSSVCAIDAQSLRVQSCVRLEASPDGVAYVAAAKQVWVTVPRERSIAVVDVAGGALTQVATIPLDGQPEGFAVDDARGVFYTNLEDRDRTLSIAVATRQVTKTWEAGCGEEGPRGLALDTERDILMVACTDRVTAVAAGRDGQHLSTIGVGEGLDNIDYVPARHELYAAAARAATLTVARLESDGSLTAEGVVPTVAGARNAVATDDGTAYLTDSAGGRIVAVAPIGACL
jgi:YVTN family beta-propeller protein